MVEKYPYRVMSSFTFDVNETPLRSARLAAGPTSEEVVSSEQQATAADVNTVIEDDTAQDDFSICHFPKDREFVIAVREAEKTAKSTGVRAPYYWRGYRGYVAPGLPPITVPGLQVRMMNAMQRIPLSVPETMVK